MRLRAPWWVRAACLAVVVCCGCAHKSAEQHELAAELKTETRAEGETETTSHAAADTSEKRVEQPTEIETSKSQLGLVVQGADGGVTVARVGRKPLALPKGSKVIGTVPLSETKRDEHRGGVVDEKQVKATEDSAAKAKTSSTTTGDAKIKERGKLTTSTSWGPPWWAYLLAGLAVAIAGFVLWHLKPPWLGWLWKLLGSASR